MEIWMLMPLLFACGYLLGRSHNRRWRRDRVAALKRKLQLIAERNENKGLRHKGKRPSLKSWQKWFLGLLHWWSPTLTRYTLFRPETLIGWFNRYVRCYWWLISSARKLNLPGRPRIAPSVEQIINDWRARPLFILSVLNHHRRQLIYCRCTYHPRNRCAKLLPSMKSRSPVCLWSPLPRSLS